MSWFTSTWTEPSASPTGRIGWAVIAPKAWPSRQRKLRRPKTLWKRRSVEKSKNRLFHRAWKSRKVRGIPTFPQRRRLLDELQQPDISLATKSGHFNLLRTVSVAPSTPKRCDCSIILDCVVWDKDVVPRFVTDRL